MLVQKEQEAVSVDAAEAKLPELLQVDDFWSRIDERLHICERPVRWRRAQIDAFHGHGGNLVDARHLFAYDKAFTALLVPQHDTKRTIELRRSLKGMKSDAAARRK